jgi:hypothetical protein
MGIYVIDSALQGLLIKTVSFVESFDDIKKFVLGLISNIF